MLDTVLLELEGVIADTGEARHDAIVAALHADGVNLPENDYRDLCAGLSFEEAIRAASTEPVVSATRPRSRWPHTAPSALTARTSGRDSPSWKGRAKHWNASTIPFAWLSSRDRRATTQCSCSRWRASTTSLRA
jgi:beta-phosphoglucomutase-like phosphatase (HAD superfamily)